MARNDIGLDQINRRLGGGNSRAHPSDFGAASPDNGWPSHDVQQDKGTSVSSGFVVTVLGVFLAAGSGTYFFMGEGVDLPDLGSGLGFGKTEEVFVSKADAACGAKWRKGQSNDEALRCYLTTQVARLCDSEERVHLSSIIKKYRKDHGQYHAGLVSALYKQQGDTISRMAGTMRDIEKIADDAKVMKGADGKLTAEQKKKISARVEAKSEEFYQGGAGYDPSKDAIVLQNQAATQSQQAEVSHARKLQALAEAGYVSESDFGWFPDVIVKKAFAKAKGPATNPCG